MRPVVTERWMYAAATSTLLAAYLHGHHAGEHFEEWWGYGALFVLAGLLQAIVGGLVVLRPTRLVYAAGIALHAGLILFYAYTRLVGVPFGPEAGEREPIGADELAAKAAELVSIVSLAVLARADEWRGVPLRSSPARHA